MIRTLKALPSTPRELFLTNERKRCRHNSSGVSISRYEFRNLQKPS